MHLAHLEKSPAPVGGFKPEYVLWMIGLAFERELDQPGSRGDWWQSGAWNVRTLSEAGSQSAVPGLNLSAGRQAHQFNGVARGR
jgi:hypothetical protein